MPLTIKGIEAAKPKYNAISGKYVQTKLSDGDGLFLIVTEKAKHGGRTTSTWVKNRRFLSENTHW